MSEVMTFKEHRQKMGLNLAQMSRLFGIPYSTLQKWEYGIHIPADYIMNMMWEIYNLRKQEGFDSIVK